MIEHELLFLGLLKEGRKHGYEIKRKIKEILSIFAGVDLKSVYYPLKVLEKKGLVVQRMMKHGRRPPCFVYELTKKGEARFNELFSKSFLELKRPQFSLDLSLYFLRFMKPDIVRRRVRGRIFILNKLSKAVKQMLHTKQKKDTPSSLALILEHDLKMLEAEMQFLEHLLKTM
jgi:DNA-binding PadR family transcriptional regulator